MIQDLFRCSVYGEEQVLTRPEYEAQRALALRRGKPYGVKLGPKCGVRFDDTPEPAEPSPAISAPPTVKPAPAISAPAEPTETVKPASAPEKAPTDGAQQGRRNRRRPRRKPAKQAQEAPQNATGDKRKDSEQ